MKKGKKCKVGYKSPPVEYQFTKGRSGNPPGRPPKDPLEKSQKMLREALQKTLDQKVKIQGKNGVETVSIVEAGFRSCMAHAIKKGDWKTIEAAVHLVNRLQPADAEILNIIVTGGLPRDDDPDESEE